MDTHLAHDLFKKFSERSYDRPATCFLRTLEACIFIEELHAKKGLLLDIGCGDGFFNSVLHDTTQLEFTGVDVSFKNLTCAQNPWQNKTIINASGSILPFKNDTFNLIISNSSLEHFTDIGAVLNEMHRIAKPGSACIITVPLHNTFIRKGAFEKKLEQAYTREHSIRTYWDDETWCKCFKNHRFKIIKKIYYLNALHGKKVFYCNFLFNFGTGNLRVYTILKKITKILEKRRIFAVKYVMKKIGALLFNGLLTAATHFGSESQPYYNACYVILKQPNKCL